MEMTQLDKLSFQEDNDPMNTRLTVGEFKANFSKVIEIVKQGGSVEVEYGRSRRVVGVFAPPNNLKQRKLGILEGKAHFAMSEDWKLDTETFLSP